MRLFGVFFVIAIICVALGFGKENPLKPRGDAPLAVNPFDTDHRTFHFQPNVNGGYNVDTIAFGFDATLGTNLNLGDDNNATVSFGFTFSYYGVNWSAVHVSANGLIAFGADVNPSGFFASADFFNTVPKIAGYFLDLNASAGGGVFQKTEATKLTITWNNVPEYGISNSNTFQLILHNDGSFDVTFNGIGSNLPSSPSTLGISAGGTPPLVPISFSNDLPYSGASGAGVYEQYGDFLPPFTLGPKSGSIPGGVSVTTNNFSFMSTDVEAEKKVVPNTRTVPLRQAPPNVIPPKGPAGSNYRENNGVTSPDGSPVPVVVQDFSGIPQTGFIPPDPEMAVGPNHVIACVNAAFRIWDKNGTLLKSISAASWFASSATGSSFSDPQIIYDHFANRWVIAWGNFSGSSGQLMISVSDDDNPIGTWYNWALPGSSAGDSLIPGTPDYPQMGFDNQALYLTAREFATNGSFYCSVRIIGKAQLYANTAGPVTWKDFWNLRDPDFPFVAPDGVEPVVSFGPTGTAFLMNQSPFFPGTYFTLWKIHDPLGSPTLSAVNIPVVQYAAAPRASQLGGSSLLFETDDRMTNQPVYRDSSIWAVHSIANPTNSTYSAMHYIRFNPFTNTNLQDAAMGSAGFWHFYPAIMVTQDTSVIVTFSRSGDNEYVGAYVSGRKNSDPPGLSPSVPVKAGQAHYVQDFGSGRNRWGDYSGIGLDPVEPNTVWTFTEFAASPQNTWGTWVGKVKMGPLAGAYILVDRATIGFGTHEVFTSSDTISISIRNNGLDTLVIPSITLTNPQFALVNPPSLPIRLSTYESMNLLVRFFPHLAGDFIDTLVITSNATNIPSAKVALSGSAFVVRPALAGIMYATTGSLLTVDPNTGATVNLGATGYSSILNARVNPATNELLGLAASGSNTLMLRINSLAGDVHSIGVIPLNNLKGMAFRGDTLYVGRITGALYRVNIATGASTIVATTSPLLNFSGLAFHPTTGELYASVRVPAAQPDRIYRVSLPSGAATLVGSTGQGPTQDIIFSNAGQLFGITNTGATTNNLIRIDTSTGVGTLVGSMGITGAQGLATRPDSSFLTGVRERKPGVVPAAYALDQNYPNPFNPTTQIRYALPQQSRVMLTIFNVVGQEVMQLVNEVQAAGFYEASWNGADARGRTVASGIYFYKLEGTGSNGVSFINTKKMLLLK